MATFELKNKIEHEGEKYSEYTIVVTFDNPNHVPEHEEKGTHEVELEDGTREEQEYSNTIPAVGEPQFVFEQNVILPDSGTDKAAQEYADDYEKQYNETHKEG